MNPDRKPFVPALCLPLAIGVTLAAMAALMAFPRNPAVWQVEAWTLVLSLFAVVVLVLECGYALATRRVRRSWQRLLPFVAGVALLLAIAIGSS